MTWLLSLFNRPEEFRVSILTRIGAEVRFWLYQHPRTRRTMSILFLWAVLIHAGATAAFAADGTGQGSGLFLPTAGIHDTHGIPIDKYMSLPLDRGDAWTPQKMWITSILDFLWVGHIFYIAMLFAMVKFLLAFEWIEFIASPLNGIAVSFQALVNQIYWIPFALMVTAFVAGIYILRGKFSSGLIECVVAVVIAIAATGVLANPVATITGPDGILNKAKIWGGEISVAITTDRQPCMPGGNCRRPTADTTMSADKVLAENVIAQLVDTFVRVPAQTVTFGHVLTGDCDKVFDKAFNDRNPINVAETNVRDRVGECDKDAKEYVQSPVITKIGVMANIQSGSFFMNLLILGLSLYIISSVFSSLWNGLKAMFASLWAVLPSTSRTGLWRSIIGIYSSCVMIVVALIFLAGYMKVLVSITALMSRFGIVLQMAFVNIAVLVFLIGLWRLHRRAKKAGETLAQRLGKLGLGADEKPRSQTVKQLTNRVEPWVRDAWRDARLTKNLKPKQQQPQPQPGLGWAPNGGGTFTDLGEKITPTPTLGSRVMPALTSGPGAGPTDNPPTPAPGGPGGGGTDGNPSASAKTATSLDFVGTAAQFIPHPAAKAVGAAAKIGSTAARTKAAIEAPATGQRTTGQGSTPDPAHDNLTRRITVDSHGNGSVSPRLSVDQRGNGSVNRPLEGTIIDAPAAPPAPRSARSVELSAKLAQLRSVRPVGSR